MVSTAPSLPPLPLYSTIGHPEMRFTNLGSTDLRNTRNTYEIINIPFTQPILMTESMSLMEKIPQSLRKLLFSVLKRIRKRKGKKTPPLIGNVGELKKRMLLLIIAILVIFETFIAADYRIETTRSQNEKEIFETNIENASINSYQLTELEIVRIVAGSVGAYIEEQTRLRGEAELPQIQEEAIHRFVKPVRLCQTGNLFIYTREHVVFNERDNFSTAYRNMTIYEAFYVQREKGASHYLELADMVMNGKEGATWYIWLPETGKEVAAVTNQTVNGTTWAMVLSTPLKEIMDSNGAASAIQSHNTRVNGRLRDDRNSALFISTLFMSLLILSVAVLQRLEKEFIRLDLELKERNRKLEESRKGLERRVKLRTKRLRDAQEMLIHNQRLAAVGAMSAGVAHEINNPLTTIQNLFYLLRTEGNLDPGLVEYLELAEESAERINEIVKSLNAFSRKDQAAIISMNIPEKIENIFTVLGKRFAHHGINVHVDTGEVKEIHSSPSLQQVFVNIIMNALDAMPEGGDLYIRAFSTKNSYVFEFRDTGIGMSPDVIKRVFEPFFTTKEPGRGTGLGLTVSYGIVKQHGGRIEVDSAPDKGTIFRVVIPSDLKELKEEFDVQGIEEGEKGKSGERGIGDR